MIQAARIGSLALLVGATLSRGRFALLLDSDRVLSSEELLAVAAAGEPPAPAAAAPPD